MIKAQSLAGFFPSSPLGGPGRRQTAAKGRNAMKVREEAIARDLRASVSRGSKFALNKTLTTWPKFLLSNHRRLRHHFLKLWRLSVGAPIVSGVSGAGGFIDKSFHSVQSPTHAHLAISGICEREPAVNSYWLINQYLKEISTYFPLPSSTFFVFVHIRPTLSRPVSLLFSLWSASNVNICKDSQIIFRWSVWEERASGARKCIWWGYDFDYSSIYSFAD